MSQLLHQQLPEFNYTRDSESTTESPTDRKAHDIKQVSEIFSELLEVKTTVEEAVRLGFFEEAAH